MYTGLTSAQQALWTQMDLSTGWKPNIR